MNVEYSKRAIADLRKVAADSRAFGEIVAAAVDVRIREIIAQILKHPEGRPRVIEQVVEKLKLSEIPDDKPVKLTIELPAPVHRDLVAYSEVLARETGKSVEVVKLIPAMLARFMSTDRAFLKARREKEGAK
jgi:hypothetical protein